MRQNGAQVTFSHPLARNAEIFAAHSLDGDEKAVLAIVTTLELDPKSKKYKKSSVDRLSSATQKYVADSRQRRDRVCPHVQTKGLALGRRGSGSGCGALSLSTGRSIRA
jgi:hypothetical protein